MTEDLSKFHHPVGALLARTAGAKNIDSFRLSEEQVEFFHEDGYLKGIRILLDEQVEALRGELEQLMNPDHPGRHLFHEYHSNESTDLDRVLFHALGAWRVMPGFHDLLWNHAFLVPARQLLGGPVRFWHDQLFCKPALPHSPAAVTDLYAQLRNAITAGNLAAMKSVEPPPAGKK